MAEFNWILDPEKKDNVDVKLRLRSFVALIVVYDSVLRHNFIRCSNQCYPRKVEHGHVV